MFAVIVIGGSKSSVPTVSKRRGRRFAVFFPFRIQLKLSNEQCNRVGAPGEVQFSLVPLSLVRFITFRRIF
jgi:hypothetical protein